MHKLNVGRRKKRRGERGKKERRGEEERKGRIRREGGKGWREGRMEKRN